MKNNTTTTTTTNNNNNNNNYYYYYYYYNNKECMYSTYEIWMGRIFRTRGNGFGQVT